jgi:hypothetical protein
MAGELSFRKVPVGIFTLVINTRRLSYSRLLTTALFAIMGIAIGGLGFWMVILTANSYIDSFGSTSGFGLEEIDKPKSFQFNVS